MSVTQYIHTYTAPATGYWLLVTTVVSMSLGTRQMIHTFTSRHLPFAIYHLPFTIHHLPFTIYHSPLTQSELCSGSLLLKKQLNHRP